MFYTYVLESLVDGKRYFGYTNDLRRRLGQHRAGETRSLTPRLGVKLVYYAACLNMADAKRRERYLKTSQGRRFLGLRLKEYVRSQSLGSGR